MTSPKGQKEAPLFADHERVLCFHGPLIYEGKVLKTDYKDKEYMYFVHYAGWNKSWDEWVPEKRVLKYSETNLERQKELKQAHEDNVRSARSKLQGKQQLVLGKKKSLGSDTSSGNLSTTDSRSSTPIMDQKGPKVKGGSVKAESVDGDTPRKRKRSEYVEPERQYTVKQEIHIMLPEQLKIFLVDDWDNITRQKRLVKIPVRHTVTSVLDDYLKTRKKNDVHAIELCGGIKEYFDAMLGSQLLYKFERQQYLDILKGQDTETSLMSSIYGPAHLLRFFTKLGPCLSYTTLDVEAVEVLKKCIEEFLKFLLKNYNTYFTLEDYGVSPPEYQRKVPS